VHPRLSGRGHWRDCAVPPIVKGSVIRVEAEHLPKPTGQIKPTLWLWWSGAGEPDLDLCWRAYLRRFDIEHTFRFVKGTLGWTTPAACTPTRPIDGPGSWWPPTPSSVSPAASSMISDSRGSGHAIPLSARRRACGGGFANFVQRSAHQPVHRNPRRPVRYAPKAPEHRPEPVIQRSKRPPELGQGSNSGSCDALVGA
jgi:hypothetical protein